MDNTMVKLNVGGQVFTTGRSTLTKYPSSMLATMFSDRQAGSLVKDKGGTVFIDRDGHLFSHLLEWLRTGHIRLCKIEEKEALQVEADYFLLEALSTKLKNIVYREKISNSDFWKLSQLGILYSDGGQKNSHFVLTYADLRSITGLRCLFTKTSLVRNCTQFVFTGCDLRGVILSNIDFGTTGSGLDFDHALMNNATFEKSVIKASFKGAKLCQCNFQDVKFTGGSTCFDQADLTEANFTDSSVRCGSFTNCVLKSAQFNKAILESCNFFSANMVEASFAHTQMKNACLDYGELTGAVLAEANLSGATLKHANLSRASFRGASLVKANLSHSNCCGTDFNEADKKAAIYEGTILF
ncbi:uncharacterized protein [Dysidea avara]|uniref:uncharacterized protein n=1 Tax=Dysidea avara TaxID=196820 RepID=UPI0033308B80